MPIMALQAHSHYATKTNQFTNTNLNHNMNMTSSGRTFTHVNDGQKRTHKHRNLEVGPVVHNTLDTKEAPFDAKTILPESKALKSITQLLESMKKSEPRSLTFECIDGFSRTLPAPHDINPSIASTSTTDSEPPPNTQAVPNLERSANRTGFMAFGVDAKTNDMETPSEDRRILHSAPQSYGTRASSVNGAQVLAVKEQKHHRPRINKRCRLWLRNRCNYGHRCKYVHEDFEYDDPPQTLSGRTFAHVNDGQKKTHEHRNLEVAPVVHKTMDTKEAPFDAKTILPESKALIPTTQPLESMKKSESKFLTFECINGFSRTLPAPHDISPSIASTSTTDSEPPSTRQAVPNLEPPANRTGFMAFGIDPTTVMQTPFEDRRILRSAPQSCSTPASSVNGGQVLPVKEQKHPRPRINDRCRRWLRNECDLGYRCNYVHEDLEYDDSPQEPERYVESFSTTLHDHIKFKLRAGFDVEDIITGFESPWIFMSNLPKNISDKLLLKLLRPFGEVLEIRRPLNLTSPLTLRVHFANSQDAYRAFTSLHGKTPFGCRLDLRMGLDLDNKGTIIKDSCVRIDWEAPHRTWYAGFASRALAEQALQVMQNTPYCDFLPTGTLHTTLPSVSVATVKMRFLPVDVEEQGLNIFGPIQGLMSERPSYQGHTAQGTIDGVRNLLSRFQTRMIDFEVRSPPYREAKMRAWAYFMTPADAKAAAEHLHGRKPQFTGHTRICARHIKTITFKVSVVKFRRVAASIYSLAGSIWKQNLGNSLSVMDKNSHYCLKLCGGDLKELGRLKADVEKVLNGEAVLKDGKTAWDDFFRRSVGSTFLQDLERAHTGVSIETDATRRKIRLFGVAEKRLIVREKILEKIEQLRLQKSCFIPLEGPLLAAFVNGELASLREKLGSEHIILDFEGHALRLRGDEKVFNVARDAVELVRKKYKIRRNRQAIAVECPVCFDEVSSPIKMMCGHTWCRTCFHNYLTAASEQKFFPLTCLGNEGKCTERISLFAAKDVLSAAEFDAMASAAFDTYVQTHREELHYCPTPDCPQVFRPAPEGIFLQCPSCLERICPTCNADAHDGLTCAESKDGDDLFREWADQRDVKRCPGCNIAIEKDEGCNHMKCTVCQTHICWMCMKTFPGGEGIYGHMRSEHGSFGLGPIV